MTSFDDLPQRDTAHDTAEAAVTAFRAAIGADDFFVVQRVDENDYGTDVQIEARRERAMTNLRAHVQLKGTWSSSNANGSVSLSVARSNLNYLLAQFDSIYVCYHICRSRKLHRVVLSAIRSVMNRSTSKRSASPAPNSSTLMA